MTSQLRIYTINRGMMDEWVKLFTETIVPIQEKHGIKIEGMWVSEDSTQFIWIRSFTNSEDVKAKEAAFYGSPEWNAVMDHARSHIARTVVQTMEPALNVSGDSLRRGPGKACELRIYTISRGMVEPWVKFHTDTLVPLHEKLGIRVEGSWVNEDNNQLIWIRTFDDAEDRKVKMEAWRGSPQWKSARELVFTHLARLDVQPMRPI
jgi:hypothetical protein